MRLQRAFTLVEVMVVVAVAAIIALIAAPSFRDMILMQRLKSINAQLVTDLQFARSEAVARNVPMRVRFLSNSTMTCYSIFTAPDNNARCDCRLGAGTACVDAGTVEVRTVQAATSLRVQVMTPADGLNSFAFDPTNGGIQSTRRDQPSAPIDEFVVDTSLDTPRALRVQLNGAGRPTVCLPSGSTMPLPACATLP